MPQNSTNIMVGSTYRHYKGRNYRVLATATHSETKEAYVVYQALYEDQRTWVRPAEMFCEEVDVDGQRVPRFRLLA
jgi:hypothetical protein